jgi:competence/damage-inducible protein CinA-like protein
MSVQAEVISIGDELTSGQRLDTNSQWLSERLGEIGIQVLYHTTVADDLEANVRVFQEAVRRADVVVASGGLGPTADDLTREALARLTNTELVRDAAVEKHIRGLFARFGREMPERNVLQAMFPAGSRVIPNPAGTAPGVALDVPREGAAPSRVYALPGVPAEMFQMWHATVGPELAALSGGPRVIRHQRIKCFGISESDLEQRLPDLIRRGRTPSVGITVSAATITLRITAAGATPEECAAAMAPTAATIRECLGTIVFGGEDDEMEHAVARLLTERGKTLATAEIGTGGLVADRLHDVCAGSGNDANGNYLGGLVVPSRQALIRLLGVPEELIATHSAVSGEVAAAMAAGCRERLAADLALAVGAFPDTSAPSDEPQRLFVALASEAGVTVRAAPHFGHPEILKARAAKQALNLVRLTLLAAE